MSRVAILTPSITTGDAVSNDVLGMYDVLRQSGHETRIYAEGWTFDKPKVWPAPRIRSFLKSPSDLLIYHYSRGWDFALDLLRKPSYRTAIKYHNVTPPEFAARFSKDYARMCQEGRDQLADIASAGCDLYMSASAYNERELLDEGVPEARSLVVPPFHHIDRLHSVEPDPKVAYTYADGRTNLLMVGRVSPNKGHPALIEAFAAYHHDYNPNSRLIIVGKGETRLKTYALLLEEIVRRLNLRGSVVFAGEVTDSELKAYYSLADVFMITSEHEGFCVPLVEAMSMKVPIVAYGSSAIPGTVGGAGLVWAEKNPYLLAESVHKLVEDKAVGARLGEMGLRRYEQLFTNERIRAKFVSAVGRLL
ncbi:MAG TPA: glycosyltransferase family 4 protein [Pyrinomonadaceae bacterium]|nr:glycosyltransferase family 4 protein [Pyrinomonadaceae bacterium]